MRFPVSPGALALCAICAMTAACGDSDNGADAGPGTATASGPSSPAESTSSSGPSETRPSEPVPNGRP